MNRGLHQLCRPAGTNLPQATERTNWVKLLSKPSNRLSFAHGACLMNDEAKSKDALIQELRQPASKPQRKSSRGGPPQMSLFKSANASNGN